MQRLVRRLLTEPRRHRNLTHSCLPREGADGMSDVRRRQLWEGVPLHVRGRIELAAAVRAPYLAPLLHAGVRVLVGLATLRFLKNFLELSGPKKSVSDPSATRQCLLDPVPPRALLSSCGLGPQLIGPTDDVLHLVVELGLGHPHQAGLEQLPRALVQHREHGRVLLDPAEEAN